MKRLNYPTKYELLEVLRAVTNRKFLNEFAQDHGIYITNVNQNELAEEISNLFLDNEDLERIRREAYHIQSAHALSGFTIKSSNSYFSLKDVYQWIFEEANRKSGQKLNALTTVVGENGVFKGSLEYNKKRPGRVEFLQDEVSSFDFYLKNLSGGNWQVEIDSNRSTDLKELKELLETGLKGTEEVEELEQRLLTTETSIHFFDKLAKNGMGDDWRFEDIKHITLKKGTEESDQVIDDESDIIPDIVEEDLIGITQAILQGKNLRDNPFVKQCVQNGYRFNAVTYEYFHKQNPYFMQVKAEFKGRPKVFEISITAFGELVGAPAKKIHASLDINENRQNRSIFWNNSKDVYNSLIKR